MHPNVQSQSSGCHGLQFSLNSKASKVPISKEVTGTSTKSSSLKPFVSIVMLSVQIVELVEIITITGVAPIGSFGTFSRTQFLERDTIQGISEHIVRVLDSWITTIYSKRSRITKAFDRNTEI